MAEAAAKEFAFKKSGKIFNKRFNSFAEAESYLGDLKKKEPDGDFEGIEIIGIPPGNANKGGSISKGIEMDLPEVNVDSSGFSDAEMEPPKFQADKIAAPMVATESPRRNLFYTLASLAAPLAADEFETHGLDRKYVLGLKALGDAAMFAIPIAKYGAIAARMAAPAMRLGKAATKATNYAYGSAKMPQRMLGQAGFNAADNVLYTGIENAATDRGKMDDWESYLLSAGLGGLFGLGGGAKSYGNTVGFRNYLHNKTKAKEGSKKHHEFEMYNRDLNDDEILSNSETAADIIKNLPLNKTRTPMTWEQIGKHYDTNIKDKQRQIARHVEGLNSAAAANNAQYTYPIDTPPFDSPQAKKNFYNNVENFLTVNDLGKIDHETNKIILNEGVTPLMVEDVQRRMRKGDFNTKERKDWKEETRIASRHARGGDNPNPADMDFPEFSEYGRRMRELENLHRERQIMNYASGGMGFGTPPEKYGVLSSFDKNTRPQLGLFDIDLDVRQRNAARAPVSLHQNWPDLMALLEAAKEHGPGSEQVNEAYNKLDIEGKNRALQMLDKEFPEWYEQLSEGKEKK